MPRVRTGEVDLTIVIPVYYNAGIVSDTFRSIRENVIARHPRLRFEVIFVEDGSGDRSLAELLRLQKAYPRLIEIIKFTKNFGQINALYAGWARARGRGVVSMSADGQDPPSLINQMIAAHRNGGHKIVVCARKTRDESYYRILTSKIFFGLMRKLSFPNMPPGGFDFMLLDRTVLSIMLAHQEANQFFQGHILSIGYPVKSIPYHRLSRKKGRSRWTFWMKLTYLIDGVLGYSFAPIRFISIAGILIALVGIGHAIYVLISRLLWGNPVLGWATIVVLILIIGGIQMIMLGIIGEYLWRTLAQVRNRPNYVIEKIYDSERD